MKKYFLLFALVFGLTMSNAFANEKQKESNDETLRKSEFQERPTFWPAPTQATPDDTSFPRNFNETSNPRTEAAVSTGYYLVDNKEIIPQQYRNPDNTHMWQVNAIPTDTTVEPAMWRRILSGPRQLPREYWDNNKQEGLRFFRNPIQNLDFFDHTLRSDGAIDSTDDAIAGPIPIGITGGFYFNGIRYDSFYVSTNGIIALTNRRYFYDASGNRYVPEGATSAYDPMSMDWFVKGYPFGSTGPCTRCRTYADNGGGPGTGDNTRDDFGYMHSVLGLDPNDFTANNGLFNPLGGIRARGGQLNTTAFSNTRAALIAPVFGDMMLSQYNPETRQVEDYGRAYYKRFLTADRLIISWVNMQIKGSVNHFYGTATVDPNLRPQNSDVYVAVDIQVTLDRRDSSITFIYKKVDGDYNPSDTYGYAIIRRNTTAGVYGWARHVNYPTGVPKSNENYPWGGEYNQFTHYFMKFQDESGTVQEFPQTSQAVKFKQWQNTVRVASIKYMVRDSKNLTIPLDQFPVEVTEDKAENYEFFAGMPRIGAFQPVALVQNLTNDIQGPAGVNFVPQDLKFRVRFRVVNLVTNKNIYNRLAPIDSICLSVGMSADPAQRVKCNGDPTVRVRLAGSVTKNGANYTVTPEPNFSGTGYNGIPPYKFVQVYFPPFEPNEFLENHIGRLRSFTTAEPVTPNGDPMEDQWPFDDESSLRFFVVNRLNGLNDNGSEFHNVEGVNMPSVWKWVNIDAEEVAGEQVSVYPQPPRRIEYAAMDRKNLSPNIKLASPCIKLNRVTLGGGEHPQRYKDGRSPARNGDQIRSFPIDLRGKFGSVISLSVQRTTKQDNWPRGFGDQSMVGPEARVIQAGDVFAPLTAPNAQTTPPDELVVEIAKPSDDGLNGIVNLDEQKDWSVHPVRKGGKPVGETETAQNPALTIFGGGGYMIGFLETDKDSSLALPDLAARKANGLRADMYDDGIDFEFKRYFIAIPDTFIRWKNEGARNFRFRIRVFATDNTKTQFCPNCIPDDQDDFYVDNVAVSTPTEIPDLEVTTVKILWPYTAVPASQATSIPVRVKLSNNSSHNAPNLSVKVKIYRANSQGDLRDKEPIYCRTEPISNLNAGSQLELTMPAWNARKSQKDTLSFYRIEAIVMLPEKDLVSYNDTNFTFFQLRFADVFAYDPVGASAEKNTVGAIVGSNGKGLNLPGSSFTGYGSYTGPSGAWGGWNPIVDATGTPAVWTSGQIAMRFEVNNTDTLRGFSAYWATLNQSPDPVDFIVYREVGGIPSEVSQSIPGTWVQAVRGNRENFGFERYVDYILTNPVELPRGAYWLAVAQLGSVGYELGGSSSRMGMRTMSVYVNPTTGLLGEGGTSFLVDKDLRQASFGNKQVNMNLFAYENYRFSNSWVRFMPTTGNPAYPHKDHFGQIGLGDGTLTLTQGTWIPMLRPYFGFSTFGADSNAFQWCPDDIPVELTSLKGNSRAAGIDLRWETASEVNNKGFYVERRNVSRSENEWSAISFQDGAGNAQKTTYYNYLDRDVALNNTYEYRLRQEDYDGTQNCGTSNIVRVKFERVGALTINSVGPNPFTAQTTINFNLPETANTKLEVLDLFGNVVKTLVNQSLDAREHAYTWNATNEAGLQVPTGAYIIRLTSGNETLTAKVSFVK
ncbi:MAG: FlgD immunoglobulin-like domain containing protein [Chloroflexota bacterium]